MNLLAHFKEMAQALYESHQRRFQPMYPWVLVRVLPKENRPLGLVIMPENATNKILYEGIVLEIWKPFWKQTEDVIVRENDSPLGTLKEKRPARTRVWTESALQPGDHILFPHYEGLPVPYLNAEEKDAYRIVREINAVDPRCEVVGKLEYVQDTAVQKLTKALESAPELSGDAVDQLTVRLMDEFYMVPKLARGMTVSGQ